MMEIILMVAVIGVLFVIVWRLHGEFSSGMSAEDIEELGRGLEKMGYKRKEDVDGFAYFERRKGAAK